MSMMDMLLSPMILLISIITPPLVWGAGVIARARVAGAARIWAMWLLETVFNIWDSSVKTTLLPCVIGNHFPTIKKIRVICVVTGNSRLMMRKLKDVNVFCCCHVCCFVTLPFAAVVMIMVNEFFKVA
jgi:hypothetical protein